MKTFLALQPSPFSHPFETSSVYTFLLKRATSVHCGPDYLKISLWYAVTYLDVRITETYALDHTPQLLPGSNAIALAFQSSISIPAKAVC